jgi:hypothetical protein
MSAGRIAILIDGGFFLKRLPKLVAANRCASPGKIVACIRHMCRNHVKNLTGANDKAEINEEAWATLNSDTSRPFDKPTSGRVAVKVINHLGDGGTVNAFDTMANGFSFGSI